MNKILFLITLLFLFSCHAQQKSAKQKMDRPEAACKPTLLLDEEANAKQSDPFDIDSLAISENCLEVFVSYSGGCGGAVFNLYSSNRVMQSMPPQATLFLSFKDDDPCRSIVQDTLFFDLSNFKKPDFPGGIWLRLKNSDKRVMYKPGN